MHFVYSVDNTTKFLHNLRKKSNRGESETLVPIWMFVSFWILATSA